MHIMQLLLNETAGYKAALLVQIHNSTQLEEKNFHLLSHTLRYDLNFLQ